jgi:hypothetical protein
LGGIIGLKGPISAEREINLFNNFLIGFFDQHLVNPDSSHLEAAIQEYSEVNFEKR